MSNMPKEYIFTTKTGKEFSFPVPEPGEVNSFFLFSLPKAGSTLLMHVMADVCTSLNIPTVDLPTKVFSLGMQPAELTGDINSLWRSSGYAYIGFRSFLPPMHFDFSATKNILLVRDPRDMLVSLYFSMKYSHVVPEVEEGEHPIRKQRAVLNDVDVNQAVLNMAPAYRKYFKDYFENLPTATTRVYRYEDVIFKKKEWLEDMLDFLGLELHESKIKAIADKYDIRPDREDPQKHVRQVTPGNYKTHLSQATIDKLDDLFGPVMHYFYYDSVISLKLGDVKNGGVRYPARKLFMQDAHVKRLERDLAAMKESWSWRLSLPVRLIGSFFMGKK